jgi:hypothetical protein
LCTTELGYVAKMKPEFDKRKVKTIGLSIDPVESPQGAGPRTIKVDPGPRLLNFRSWPIR